MRKTLLILLSLLPLGVLHAQQDTTSAPIEASVRQQLQHYPASTLKDLYKNFFQDAFGPGHLFTGEADAQALPAAMWKKSASRPSRTGTPVPSMSSPAARAAFTA